MLSSPSHLAVVREQCRLAAIKRARLSIPVVAITGTAGKTTTKEMVRRILSLSREVSATRGNVNANPAIPILAARPSTRAIVAEVGMNEPGLIAWQCRIIRPTVGIITNVGHAHAEACGGFAGVVLAKNELVYGLAPGGTLILNADDDGSKLLRTTGFHGRIIRFGRAADSEYRLNESRMASDVGRTFTVDAEGALHRFTLPAPGEHLIYDALAAMAAARTLDASWDDIERALAQYAPVHGRQMPRYGLRGSLILDDAYNANPLSMAAGLKTLGEIARGRPTVAVLGDMEEQGAEWLTVHRDVGRAVADAGVSLLVTVGRKASEIANGAAAAGMASQNIRTLATVSGALRLLRRTLKPRSVVLVKGSHSAGLGRVVRGLCVGDRRALAAEIGSEAAGRSDRDTDDPHTRSYRRPRTPSQTKRFPR